MVKLWRKDSDILFVGRELLLESGTRGSQVLSQCSISWHWWWVNVCSLCVKLHICHVLYIIYIIFYIKKSQLTPNENCKKGWQLKLPRLGFCDLITKVLRWTFDLSENTRPRLTAYNLRSEGSLKGIKENDSNLYILNQSLQKWAECGDKTLGGGKKSGSRLLLQGKTLFRDHLFHLLSCESQITSMYFSFLNYKMRKWTRWPGKVFLALISMVLWEYRNFRKNLRHELF